MREPECVSGIERKIVLDEGAPLRRSRGQVVALAIEKIGVEVVVDETEEDSHAVGGRSRVIKREPSVLGDRTVDIGTEADKLGGTISVAREGCGVGTCVVVNDAESAPGGESVFSLDPGDAIAEVDGGQDLRVRTGVGIQERIDAGLKQQRTRLSAKGLAEARIPEVHDIDQTRTEDSGILRGESLTIVAQGGSRQLSWELSRNLIVGVAGEGAAQADGVLAGTIDMEIDLADQSVIAAMDRRVEAVATEVQPTVFPVPRTVPARILLEYGEDA